MNRIKIFLLKFLGLMVFSVSLTVLYLSMRAVMAVGGSCAEGGPYSVAVHCPGGTAFLTPLSIFTMMIGGGIYFMSQIKNSPEWGYFFWSALFIGLGWNFLEIGIYSPSGSGVDYSWIVCGVVFEIMGLAPVFMSDKGSIVECLIGKKSEVNGFVKFNESRYFLLALHVLSVAVGIALGVMLIGSF